MTLTSQSASARAPQGGLRQWIMSHDDRWLFIVPYIVLAVILSVVLSLFWLIVVVGVHFVLEMLRQRFLAELRGEKGHFLMLALRSVWEIKLDIGLIIFALALALYMEIVLGVVGLGAAARGTAMAGTRVASRFGVIQQALRAFLLSVDDLAQVARVVVKRRKGETTAEEAEEDEISDGRIRPGRGDYVILAFIGVCMLLIVLAPVLTDQPVEVVLAQIGEELAPLPAPEALFDAD